MIEYFINNLTEEGKNKILKYFSDNKNNIAKNNELKL